MLEDEMKQLVFLFLFFLKKKEEEEEEKEWLNGPNMFILLKDMIFVRF
jgi:hypothetical protein